MVGVTAAAHLIDFALATTEGDDVSSTLSSLSISARVGEMATFVCAARVRAAAAAKALDGRGRIFMIGTDME